MSSTLKSTWGGSLLAKFPDVPLGVDPWFAQNSNQISNFLNRISHKSNHYVSNRILGVQIKSPKVLKSRFKSNRDLDLPITVNIQAKWRDNIACDRYQIGSKCVEHRGTCGSQLQWTFGNSLRWYIRQHWCWCCLQQPWPGVRIVQHNYPLTLWCL